MRAHVCLCVCVCVRACACVYDVVDSLIHNETFHSPVALPPSLSLSLSLSLSVCLPVCLSLSFFLYWTKELPHAGLCVQYNSMLGMRRLTVRSEVTTIYRNFRLGRLASQTIGTVYTLQPKCHQKTDHKIVLCDRAGLFK